MGNQINDKVQLGDWVKLHSKKGERIHGYIEKALGEDELVQIRVIASDNQFLSGHSIQVNAVKLEVEPITKYFTLKELEQLIDLALETNDREWFDTLTDQYHFLKKEIADQQHVDYSSVN